MKYQLFAVLSLSIIISGCDRFCGQRCRNDGKPLKLEASVKNQSVDAPENTLVGEWVISRGDSDPKIIKYNTRTGKSYALDKIGRWHEMIDADISYSDAIKQAASYKAFAERRRRSNEATNAVPESAKSNAD